MMLDGKEVQKVRRSVVLAFAVTLQRLWLAGDWRWRSFGMP